MYSVQYTLYTLHGCTAHNVHYRTCRVYTVQYCKLYPIVHVQYKLGGGLRLCQPLTQVTALTSQEIATHVNIQETWGWQQGMLYILVY